MKNTKFTILKIDWMKFFRQNQNIINKYCPACQEDPCMCSDPF